jgi:hypothetical protein
MLSASCQHYSGSYAVDRKDHLINIDFEVLPMEIKESKSTPLPPRPPRVIFVMDTSGSMENSIDILKSTVAFMENILTKGDIPFVLITFSSTAHKEWPQDSEKPFQDVLQGISADGNTNMEAALSLARDCVDNDSYINWVIFLTDGIPNVGNINIEELSRIIPNSPHIIPITLGFGNCYNVAVLRALGEYTHIKSTTEIPGTIGSIYSMIVGMNVYNIRVSAMDISKENRVVYGSNKIKYLSVGQKAYFGWIPEPGAEKLGEIPLIVSYYDSSFCENHKIFLITPTTSIPPTPEISSRYYSACTVRLIDSYRKNHKNQSQITDRIKLWEDDTVAKTFREKVLETIGNRLSDNGVYATLYDNSRGTSHVSHHLQTPAQRQSSELFTRQVSSIN